MLTMNIQNQQPQQSFQARLFTKGLKLPKGKLKHVNELYDPKTKGMPDGYLIGQTKNNIEGKFYHETNFTQGDKDIAGIITGDLKNLFETCTPKQLADMFVKLSKRGEQIHTRSKLEVEIKQLTNKQKDAKRFANVNREHGDIKTAERQEVIAQRMGSRIEKLTKQLQKVEADITKTENGLGGWIF